jgi:hypothetical protein
VVVVVEVDGSDGSGPVVVEVVGAVVVVVVEVVVVVLDDAVDEVVGSVGVTCPGAAPAPSVVRARRPASVASTSATA